MRFQTQKLNLLGWRQGPSLAFCLSLIGAIALLGLATASASAKEVIAYFGTQGGVAGTLGGQFNDPRDVAVNAGTGDIYVVDAKNNRIQSFAQDDNGTPADPSDDIYPFISAWGADVDGSPPAGGISYEICTVVAACKAGVASGGNGTATGNGSLGSAPEGVAVDQDTGDVYVSDTESDRVNVYTGEGVFLRAFGFDVVESGPGDKGTSHEICVASNGDVCKEGLAGDGIGQIGSLFGNGGGRGIAVSPPDGDPDNGSVFLADSVNRRINVYRLDGTLPSSFGSEEEFPESAPEHVAVDSRGIVYATDRQNNSEIERYDTLNANGGGVGFLSPIPAPPLSVTNIQRKGLEIDPDLDGAGPETDILYVFRDGFSGTTVVQQFGPINKPGLVSAPIADDEVHGGGAQFNFVGGLGLNESNGLLFITSQHNIGGPWVSPEDHGVYVLGEAGSAASVSLDSLADITSTSVTLHGTINPNGAPTVSYIAEYSQDGSTWESIPGQVLGSQKTPQSIALLLDPPGGGLEPNTFYHVRLVATRFATPSVVSPELTFTTGSAPPMAETTGSPIRTATTARLEGRIVPRNSSATFHFEYGNEGPCSSNPCMPTAPVAAGSGGTWQLAATEVDGLTPSTTYHYRLIADNGNPGSPVAGQDMTVTTRASDAALSHGDLPGPPGSDRGWEQVSLPDTSGNPVGGLGGNVNAISDDGSRVVYTTSGGNSSSPVGSLLSQFLAERTATGWQTRVSAYPPRSELSGGAFIGAVGPDDLSSYVVTNGSTTDPLRNIWRIRPDGSPEKLFEPVSPQEYRDWLAGSDGSDRVVVRFRGGTLDPAYPGASAVDNLYDVSTGSLQLVSLLPGNEVAVCGAGDLPFGTTGADSTNWISADGSLVFFRSRGNDCAGTTNLYMRDLDAVQTKVVSPPPLSGRSCSAILLKSTDQSVFFYTQSRLTADDSNPALCTEGEGSPGEPDGDVYRYEIASETLECVTCVVPGLDVDVFVAGVPSRDANKHMAVSDDGSTVYFQSSHRLVPGAPDLSAKLASAYRLDVDSGQLRWIGGPGAVGTGEAAGAAITESGETTVFEAEGANFDPLGDGSDNAGTNQYYRYDDRDRSLICISCPPDGRPAGAPSGPQGELNEPALAGDGRTIAFTTPVPLVTADLNAPALGQDPGRGRDVYEWRDGRLLLVSDGLTTWPNATVSPSLYGITPTGKDIFFGAAAQYTADALDAFNRLYDARIGGGFEFPKPPPPCSLEVCQGTPKGAPSEGAPGTAAFAGPGNASPTPILRCGKGKRKVRRAGKARCVKRKGDRRRKASQNRRNAR